MYRYTYVLTGNITFRIFVRGISSRQRQTRPTLHSSGPWWSLWTFWWYRRKQNRRSRMWSRPLGWSMSLTCHPCHVHSGHHQGGLSPPSTPNVLLEVHWRGPDEPSNYSGSKLCVSWTSGPSGERDLKVWDQPIDYEPKSFSERAIMTA